MNIKQKQIERILQYVRNCARVPFLYVLRHGFAGEIITLQKKPLTNGMNDDFIIYDDTPNPQRYDNHAGGLCDKNPFYDGTDDNEQNKY